MKTADPMPLLRKIFMGTGVATLVKPPIKTRGKPWVEIKQETGAGCLITFGLKKIVKGQTFLGIYPARECLPNVNGLAVGDYALLGSGEVIQIL